VPWTARDIPDLDRRDAIVTGANSGLGLQIALELARRRARVVLAVRDTAKGDEAAKRIRAEAPGAELEVARLDLADLSSVREFAGWYRGSRTTLDLLVNNAGVMALPRRETADGFEMQFGTNHLGHFALTGLLLPALLDATRPARVVTMSSGAHQLGGFDFDDLQRERRYQRWMAYGQSKLANLLFAFELSRRAAIADVDLTSVAAHPGYAATNLQTAGARMEGSGLKERLALLGNRLFAQSGEQGALPALYAATMPDVVGGEYFGPDGRSGMRGHPTRAGTTKKARDPELAERLWRASEELTGVTYDRLRPAASAQT
jgi:NAD(P)-dependent dehydrogenase (short-subunit alcohol dehydrogenase family)